MAIHVRVDGADTLTVTKQALLAEQLKVEQLEAALRTNRRIGVATGIVMMTEDVDAGIAFESLRHTSMDLNRRLADLADDVIYLRRRPTPRRSARKRRG